MECEDCKYRKFDHYVDGSPCAVYQCGHPEALEIWAKFDGEKCPAEVENEQTDAADGDKHGGITHPEGCICHLCLPGSRR